MTKDEHVAYLDLDLNLRDSNILMDLDVIIFG